MRFTLEELIDFAEDLSPKISKDENNLTAKCPSCGHREFGISLLENHPFNCWRKSQCGITGNIYSLAKLLDKKLKQDFVFVKRQLLTSTLSLQEELTKQIEIKEPKEIILPLGYKRLQLHSYLAERGFTESDYDNYEVGFTNLHFKLKNYVIFPIKENNINVGYVGRSIYSKEKIQELKNKDIHILRYRNSEYTNFEDLLYGYNELTENTHTIIIVEGIFDKINVDRQLQLRNSESIKCIATFKCNISKQQLFKISNFKIENIILLYDNDVISNIKKNGIKLSEFYNTNIAVSDCKNDPGDMTYQELSETLCNLRTPQDFNNQYIVATKLNI